MKVLVIAPQPFFTPRGTPLSVYYRTLIAAEQGMEIDLLTYGQGANVVIDGVRIVRTPAFEPLGRVRVGPSLLKAFHDLLLFGRMTGLLLRNRYDVVHAHEEAVFFCLALRPLFGFRFVYDMHSSLPKQLVNFEFSRSKLLTGLFERLERRALRKAHVVVTVCDDLFRYASERVPDSNRLLLIENALFDPVRLEDASSASSPRASEAPAAAVVDSTSANGGATRVAMSAGGGGNARPAAGQLLVYAGTLEPYQGISLLIEAFALVAERRADTELLIAGGSDDQIAAYAQEARSLGLEGRCRFVGQVPREDAKRLAARADVLISPRIAGTNVPLKIYEQLASGRPIVATNVYAHTQVLSDDVAFLGEPDPESFAAAMLQALDDDVERARRVRAARALYERDYSPAMYREKMRKLAELMR